MTRAKIGMSTSAAISAAPTKKLTTSAPQAGARRERAVRDQRLRGPADVQPNSDGGDERPGEQPGAGGGEHRHLGVGGGERQDDAGQREGQQRGAEQVGPAGDLRPATYVDQRPSRGQAPGEEPDGEDDRREPDRREPPGVADERHEAEPEGDLGGEHGRLQHRQHQRDQREQQQPAAEPVAVTRHFLRDTPVRLPIR